MYRWAPFAGIGIVFGAAIGIRTAATSATDLGFSIVLGAALGFIVGAVLDLRRDWTPAHDRKGG